MRAKIGIYQEEAKIMRADLKALTAMISKKDISPAIIKLGEVLDIMLNPDYDIVHVTKVNNDNFIMNNNKKSSKEDKKETK